MESGGGEFVEVCLRRSLKVNVDKRKVKVLGREECHGKVVMSRSKVAGVMKSRVNARSPQLEALELYSSKRMIYRQNERL